METYQVQSSGGAAAVGGVFMLVWLAIAVVSIVSMWKVFAKAGKPGWACLIPIYNIIVLLQVAGKPLWWIILFFIPIANLIAMILAMIGLANNFGKGGGFAAGLILLPIIFFPILAFSDARYVGTPSS